MLWQGKAWKFSQNDELWCRSNKLKYTSRKKTCTFHVPPCTRRWKTCVNVWILFWYQRCSGSCKVNLELSERRQWFLSQFCIWHQRWNILQRISVKFHIQGLAILYLACLCIIQIHIDEISAWQQGLIHDHFLYFFWRGRLLFQVKEFWREFLSFRCNVILELLLNRVYNRLCGHS